MERAFDNLSVNRLFPRSVTPMRINPYQNVRRAGDWILTEFGWMDFSYVNEVQLAA